MTLLPITERTTYCFHECGKDICSCKPSAKIDIVNKLKDSLNKIPKEKLKKIWESGNHLDNCGIKVVDFLKDKEV